MAVYSVNQATQMMVAATQGTIGNDTYYTAEGVPTIIVPAGSVIYETDTTIAGLDDTATAYTITVPDSITAGDEFIVRVHVTTDFGVANTYIKTIGVVAKSDATITATAISNLLQKALKRDIEADFTVDNSVDKTVLLTPVKHWTLGKRSVIPTLYVEVVCIKSKTIEGEDLTSWIVPSEVDMGNGLDKLKDLEWFCAGERGDQYRGVSYPNDIPFVSKLGVLENKDKEIPTNTPIKVIHFANIGSNEAVQKSEQTLVIVGEITEA